MPFNLAADNRYRDELKIKSKGNYIDYLISDILLPLKSTGRSRSVDDFNLIEYYYEKTGEKPSRIFRYVSDTDVDGFSDAYSREKFINNLKDYKTIFEEIYYSSKYAKEMKSREYLEVAPGYIIILNISTCFHYFMKESYGELKASDEIIESHQLLFPSKESQYYNADVETKLIQVFKNSHISQIEESVISMVSFEDGELYARDFVIDKKVKIKDLDLHYGENFTDFHKSLLKKLKKETKGLILLHGEAGTGKTFYIRYLLEKLIGCKKNILYFPPTMVEAITDPNFISFISKWASESENNLLLIEDAEPLLVSRDSSRNIGISNLLNLTDGILNDIFKIQILATFNTNFDELDKALLRPERLIARKEFKKLSIDNAKSLAKKIRVDEKRIDKEMSLAEIYSIKNKNETITHDVKKNDNKIGFRK